MSDTREAQDWWSGRTIQFGTKHGKATIVAPIFAQLGLSVTTFALETDRFGTFSGEITRRQDQRATALHKAEATLHESSCDIALASEGSFGPHPSLPLVGSNYEVLTLIDATNQLTLTGTALSVCSIAQAERVRSLPDVDRIAATWNFPTQGIVVRINYWYADMLHKELRTLPALRATVAEALRSPFTRRVTLETDLRAHRCPSRHDTIRAAAVDLVATMLRICPTCAKPGVHKVASEPGLPCQWCDSPTDRPLKHMYQCASCSHLYTAFETGQADPGDCQYCNP